LLAACAALISISVPVARTDAPVMEPLQHLQWGLDLIEAPAAWAYGWGAAIEYAAAHDVLVVAAASNSGFPVCENGFSGAQGNVLCVGGVDRLDRRSSFANHGPGLDVVAPAGVAASCGADLPLSLYPVNFTPLCEVEGVKQPGYDYWGGTSQATAFVSGVGALLAEQGIRGAAAAERIKASADDLGPAGWDLDFGHGRVNARRAVTGDLNPGLPILVP